MKKEKVTIKNIIAFIEGNIIYNLYYSSFKYLIPRYKREQIKVRIDSMNPECYEQGSCIECGCRTTHLQMASKKCKGDCYPVMLSKKRWEYLKNGGFIRIDKKLWVIKNNRFKNYGKLENKNN